MSGNPINLMSAYFAGVLDEAGQARLAAWVLESEVNADAFALFALEQHALEQVLSNEKYGDLASLSLSEFIIHDEGAEPGVTSGVGVTSADLMSLANMEAGAEVAGPISLTERILQEELERRREEAERSRPVHAEPAGPKVIVLPRMAVYGTIAAMVLFAVLLAMHWGIDKPAATTVPPIADALQVPRVATFETDHGALWAGPRLAAGQPMAQGDYQLLRGRASIRFNDGALLVVESPSRFTLDSTNGVTLDDGQLVAYCDVNAHGFVVNTPYAEFVDLGTEFGVKVVPGAESQIHVFSGEVQARSAGASAHSASPILVQQTQAYSASAGSDALVPLAGSDESLFVTTRRVEVPVWNTGQELDGPRSIDPHWHVTQIDGQTLPQPARAVGHLLTRADPLHSTSLFRANIPGQSSWILVDPEIDSGEKQSYTYETRFELGDELDLRTLVLDIGFTADNYVSAIRLNGQNIAVPEHRRRLPYIELTHVQIGRGFAAGVNRLEIVVNNVPNQSVRANRTAMMAELQFTGQRDWKRAAPNVQTVP